MNIPWDGLPQLQNFFQLDFLFSGLQVSSTEIILGRLCVFLIFGAGLIWAAFKIMMKVLDCVQTFLSCLGSLPRSFFLLLLLTIPLSQNSLGAGWIGYILLAFCLLGLAGTAVSDSSTLEVRSGSGPPPYQQLQIPFGSPRPRYEDSCVTFGQRDYAYATATYSGLS